MAHILIVEDEAPIRHMVSFRLTREGYTVTEAEGAAQVERQILEQLPDLILLDWMLPGKPGIELLRELRRSDYSRDVPVIMLTARAEEEHLVKGLESGADDYITKPFSPAELVARIRALLRRVSPEKCDESVTVDGLTLDPLSHRVTAEGAELRLGPTEFRLLRFFMNHPERVFNRRQLLDRVWGKGIFVEDRTVDVHIRRLRQTLEPKGYDRLIQTVRGAGYRFSQHG